MAISKAVDGANTTVTFSYTAETQKVTDTLTDAAKYLYDKISHGVTLAEGETVEDLTNGEVGTICDAYVKKVLKAAAKTYYVNKEKDTAGDAAETTTETRYVD